MFFSTLLVSGATIFNTKTNNYQIVGGSSFVTGYSLRRFASSLRAQGLAAIVARDGFPLISLIDERGGAQVRQGRVGQGTQTKTSDSKERTHACEQTAKKKKEKKKKGECGRLYFFLCQCSGLSWCCV